MYCFEISYDVGDNAMLCGVRRTKEIFASVGADGSVRMFDLRSLEHSTIIYETHDLTPLMRLSWNKQDPNYLATIPTDSTKTVILDIRRGSGLRLVCLNAAWLWFLFCNPSVLNESLLIDSSRTGNGFQGVQIVGNTATVLDIY